MRTIRRSGRLLLMVGHIIIGIILSALPARADQAARLWPLRWWSQQLCRIIGIKITVTGEPAAKPVLLLSNHISWVDIMCLAAVCPTYFLAKAEVSRWPLFGWLCKRSGTIFIDRGDGAAQACEQISNRLQAGHRVLLFPEGTSTDGRQVRKFYARLLQSAQQAQCKVQAVALVYPVDAPETSQRYQPNTVVPFIGDDTLFSNAWRLLAEPSCQVHIAFGDTLATPDAQQSRSVVAQQCQQFVADTIAGFYHEHTNNHPTATTVNRRS